MDWDLALVVGIVLVAFTFPAVISAFSEGRAPRSAAILVMVGGGLIALALYSEPSGYTFASIPDVFVRVVGRYIN
ncbi:hypothetical protein JQU17_17555 [Ponticoccus sp. SC2-23]|uniref:hypothetical protein n=1 Tax=Alexandriicola marinus TaxID=2081710 RepID=UPI000FD800C3|nr:hypothetical protein [Alexandriicola marinus]MBM1222097.1 hypothetical protein [Ponticoccus sp. SC6-9]MBM1226784.1 hypothetical protein [Ponticoccus sp. SC6-15]MBM1231044.1 hypothetical protein [Ponticoccus sp. SC6-38]MBM1235704.1 hypothetical protein [Ponticoccus sp. SC6-45]MBM1240066.1 hypothetical protein [Ponticoccus sp. SC6-49]MBM1244420.1 hypothetical protein [Ponticoccus sp. SC2-64]MBM1249178.1 hypothetical protein [Ponticoccus sp. SC6-42]MBM1253721.1 hypothetical protein [Pontico